MPRRFPISVPAFVAAAVLIGACGSDDGGTMPPPPATTTVSFTTTAPTIQEGDTVTVVATSSDGTAVMYSSSNAAVASVDGTGLVTGVGVGSATITATAGSAAATLDVTVDPLDVTVAIDQITQNGQPIDPSNVSGPITVSVTATVPNTFDGEIVFELGGFEVGTIPINGGSAGGGVAGSSSRGSLIQRDRTLPTAVAITALEDLTIMNGPTDLSAVLRALPSLQQVGTPSVGQTLVLNNPRGVLLRMRGVRSIDAGGTEWTSPQFIDGVFIDPTQGPLNPIGIDIEAIEVVQGPQATLFGSKAASGVLTITTRRDKPFGSSGDAFGGIEGEIEWSNPHLRLPDNSRIPVHLYNLDFQGVPGIDGTRSFIDTKGPEYGASPSWDLPASVNPWLVGDTDLAPWVWAAGGDWNAGAFVDNGVGFDTCTDILVGTDVSSLTPTVNATELTETIGLNYRIGVRCGDFTLNFNDILLNDPIGIDRTSPTFTPRTGPGFLNTFDINPASGQDIGFDLFDGQSGPNLGIAYVGGIRQHANGTDFLFGSDDGAGGVTPSQETLSVPGRFSPDYSITGLYTYDISGSDNAFNLSLATRYLVVKDDIPVDVSNLSVGSIATPGASVPISASISDNLSVRNWTATLEYPLGIRLGVGRGLAWEPGGALKPTDNPDGQFQAPGSIEVWSEAVSGPQTPGVAIGAWISASDIAGLGDEEWVAATGSGSTMSFGLNGTDFFDYNLGAASVDISPTGTGAPSAVAATVQSFTAGGGSSRLTHVAMYAGVEEPGNPSEMSWWPVTGFVEFPLVDRGGFFEQVASPVIDATNPAFGLPPGSYPVRSVGTDGAGNLLFSRYHAHINVVPE